MLYKLAGMQMEHFPSRSLGVTGGQEAGSRPGGRLGGSGGRGILGSGVRRLERGKKKKRRGRGGRRLSVSGCLPLTECHGNRRDKKDSSGTAAHLEDGAGREGWVGGVAFALKKKKTS